MLLERRTSDSRSCSIQGSARKAEPLGAMWGNGYFGYQKSRDWRRLWGSEGRGWAVRGPQSLISAPEALAWVEILASAGECENSRPSKEPKWACEGGPVGRVLWDAVGCEQLPPLWVHRQASGSRSGPLLVIRASSWKEVQDREWRRVRTS